ncbi:hypothetical protein [Rossellomorea aquimaris]|uniref:hypothetical protein n=1 Tax=Rossellomorea aquimaris TaxID=189382 RepID=UPI001496228A|nr:hypothetical protein [Rossellomorea aquimaris]
MMTIYFIVLGSLFYFFFLSASEAKKDKQYGELRAGEPPLPSYIKEANQHVR